MVNHKIDSYIISLVDNYRERIKNGNFVNAYEALGELFNLINKFEVGVKSSVQINELINNQLENIADNDKVKLELSKIYDRLNNILSTGNEFIEEEFFQIFSLRFKLELINSLKNIQIFSKEKIDEIDDTLIKIGISKINVKEYTGVITSLKKTWHFVFINSKFDI